MALVEVKDQELITFMEGITSAPKMDWEQCFEVMRNDTPSMKLASMSGIGQIPVWDGRSDITPVDINDRFNTTVTYEKYALQARLNKFDVLDVPGIREGAFRKLGVAVGSTMGSIAADRLNDMWDATTTAGDGVSLISDSHPVATGGVRDCQLASAFDRSAAMTAFNLASLWTSYDGHEEDFSEDEFTFVGSPQDASLRETFGEVFDSQYSSSQMQSNQAARKRVTPLIWQKITNANRWAFLSKTRKPLTYFIRLAPEQNLAVDQDNLGDKFTVAMGIGTGVRPDPVGVIGSRTD